jgi:hypothetical protein
MKQVIKSILRFLRIRKIAPKTAGRPRSTKEKSEELARLLATPDFFPERMDAQRNAALFVQMSRKAFQRSSFLDKRIVRAGSTRFYADLQQLAPQLSRKPDRPVHFILHGAFCGSTLLARYLEELPHCLVLKEPMLLAQLAGVQGGVGPSWAEWFETTMALLSRAYASDTAVVIKTNDACNWMGSRLLDHDRQTKIIFLASPLRFFLLSTLRTEERRSWVRTRVRELRAHLAQVPFLAEIVTADLSDGECGAAIWLLNSFLCSSSLAGH